MEFCAQLIMSEKPNRSKDNTKSCKNFLETLIRLSVRKSQQTLDSIKELILGLLEGTVQPDIFTIRLQKELDSQRQPGLAAFLKKSLPDLQLAISRNELSIDGLNRPNIQIPVSSLQNNVMQPMIRQFSHSSEKAVKRNSTDASLDASNMVKPSTSKRERASISDEKVSKNIQCGFCLSENEKLRDPKVLPCSHVHCLPCLTASVETNNSVRCSQCSDTYDAIDLTKLPSALSSEEIRHWCNVCTEQSLTSEQALVYCSDCMKKYCYKHQQMHGELHSSHHIVSINMYSLQGDKVQVKFCALHQDQSYTMGCKVCLEVFCVQCLSNRQTCSAGTHHNVLSLKELVNFLRKPINKLSKRLMDKEGALLKLFKVTSDIISEYEIETRSFVAKLHESRDCQLAALKDGYSSVEADFVKARGEVLNQMKEFMEVRVEKNLSEIDHHQRRIDTRFKHSHMVDIIRGHRDSKDELGLLLDNKLAEVPKLELKNLALASKKKCRNLEIEIVPTRALVIDFLSGSATQEPQSLKLCKQVSTNQCTISVCFYAGNTYISFDGGSIAVLDSDYDIMPLHYDYMGVLDHVEGIAILNDVMYSLVTLGDESVYIYVYIYIHDLTGNYVNHWKHPDLAYSYNKITVVGNKLVVPDRQHGQLMVYSLYGEVLDQIACGLNTCMAVACANSESVVVSDSEASTVFIINIVTGETLWSCQTVGKPQGVVCYRNSSVLVYSRSSEMLCVLDIGTGKLLSEISNDGLKGSIYDLDIDGDMLIVPKCYAEQVLFYQLL